MITKIVNKAVESFYDVTKKDLKKKDLKDKEIDALLKENILLMEAVKCFRSSCDELEMQRLIVNKTHENLKKIERLRNEC